MLPFVVIWATNQRPSSSGRALMRCSNVPRSAHDGAHLQRRAAGGEVLRMVVSKLASCTTDGSAAPSTAAAGPSRPMVA